MSWLLPTMKPGELKGQSSGFMVEAPAAACMGQ